MEQGAANQPSSPEGVLPFKVRFAFGPRDLVLVAVVSILVATWVVVRGNQASVGMLGRPLRVGIVAWPGYAGGLVANNGLRANKDSEFWRNYQLLVQFVIIPDEAQLHEELVRGGDHGGIDVMWSTVDSLAQQLPTFARQGVHPRAFVQVDWSRGGDAIVAIAGIDRLEELRGKKVAVSMAASQWLLEYSLDNANLTEAERTQIRNQRVKTRGSQDALSRFIDGSVDAAVLWEPDVTEAINRRDGAHVLFDTRAAAHLIADVMVAKESFIRAHPNVISAFVKGWLLDGTTMAINNPMLAVKALLEEPDFAALGEKTTHEMLGKVAFATLEDNARMFGLADGDVFFDEMFATAGRLWAKQGYITAQAPAEAARHTVALQEIYNTQLGPAARREGCSSARMTREFNIPFPRDSAELTAQARAIIDRDVSPLTRMLSEVSFCVEATVGQGGNPQDVGQLPRAREDAVINYLVESHNLSRRRFVPMTANDRMAAAGSGPYIRLLLVETTAGGDSGGGRAGR